MPIYLLLFTYSFPVFYHCQYFYWLILVTRRVFYKKQELLTLREHLSSPRGCGGVRVAHPFSFLCSPMCLYVLSSVRWCPTHIVLCFCFVCLRLVSFVRYILPVSPDSPFLIAPSVFSNVYSNRCSFIKTFTSLLFFFISRSWNQYLKIEYQPFDPT